MQVKDDEVIGMGAAEWPGYTMDIMSWKDIVNIKKTKNKMSLQCRSCKYLKAPKQPLKSHFFQRTSNPLMLIVSRFVSLYGDEDHIIWLKATKQLLNWPPSEIFFIVRLNIKSNNRNMNNYNSMKTVHATDTKENKVKNELWTSWII